MKESEKENNPKEEWSTPQLFTLSVRKTYGGDYEATEDQSGDLVTQSP